VWTGFIWHALMIGSGTLRVWQHGFGFQNNEGFLDYLTQYYFLTYGLISEEGNINIFALNEVKERNKERNNAFISK
jgi:hypothetical protein